MKKNDILWGFDGSDRVYDSKEEAAEAWLDGVPPRDVVSLTLTEHRRVRIEKVTSPLEYMLELLDEEYGDPDGPGTKPTEAMLDAEKAFIKAIESEYIPWYTEPTGEKEVVILNGEPDWRAVP